MRIYGRDSSDLAHSIIGRVLLEHLTSSSLALSMAASTNERAQTNLQTPSCLQPNSQSKCVNEAVPPQSSIVTQ